MKRKIFFILLAAVFAAGIAFAEKLPVAKAFRPEKELYKTFANPDARHRPYVRWCWNGCKDLREYFAGKFIPFTVSFRYGERDCYALVGSPKAL